MHSFSNRHHAGKELAVAIRASTVPWTDAIILGLARGGVPVARTVAAALQRPLDCLCPRKIGVPGNSEFALGAVTEAGKALIDPLIVERLQIPESYLQEETLRQSSLAQARASLYRQGRPAPKLGGATVLLVDDGLATGSTMKAAIHGVLRDGATQVFVAVPVSPPDTLREIEALTDGVICLRAPREFYSVGQCYEDFGATTDAEVIQALNFHPKF